MVVVIALVVPAALLRLRDVKVIVMIMLAPVPIETIMPTVEATVIEAVTGIRGVIVINPTDEMIVGITVAVVAETGAVTVVDDGIMTVIGTQDVVVEEEEDGTIVATR